MPPERPTSIDLPSVDKGRERAARYGLGRALFLLRMDTQRDALSPEQCYWQLAGVAIGDMLPSMTERMDHSYPLRVAIVGYRALAEAWASSLNKAGITTKLISEDEVELAFCTGLICIVGNKPVTCSC
jgi:2-keto-3-deoxy-galactonokinase